MPDNIFRKAARCYLRWRHTRGFGVHSPFAFRLQQQVVRPGDVTYYGYRDIDQALDENASTRIRSEARMLLRLAVFLRPKSVFLSHGAHPAYHSAVKAAGSAITIERRPHRAASCDLICFRADALPLEEMTAYLADGEHALAVVDIPDGWVRSIADSMPEGLVIHSLRNALFIVRRDMRRVEYTMNV